ncbi:hypothetical protein UFOVP671_10 [uncultured Caudovirales phage]|uniref:Uncharacterized protein n=1 Tax=uncultured Caudovirales phage TaxID=2100421 RepID=A0A6J5NE74_9CAUD|nr:hypothetical protein UFOVP671_10 [uncultured Caudovirales phage]
MPLYESICTKCKKVHNYYRSISNLLDTPTCCKVKTSKVIITPCMVVNDIPNWEQYVSPATGKVISSKAQRKEDMKASGCREWAGYDQEKAASEAAKKHEIDKLCDKMDETVERTWASMPQEKKNEALKHIG